MRSLHDHERGTRLPHVIVDGELIVGRITLSNIVRGPFQSCNLGYLVDDGHNGLGFASAAVREIVDLALNSSASTASRPGRCHTTSPHSECSNAMALSVSASPPSI